MPSAPKWTTGWFGALLGLPKFKRFLAPLADSPKPLFEAAAELLDLEISHSGQDRLERVDLSKGCIMVANHPSGLVDTFASGLWITRTTNQPARFLGNQIIGVLIPEAVPYMISVNNMGRRSPERSAFNRAALGQAEAFLKKGGLLGVSPAGEVSSWRIKSPEGIFRWTDQPWNPSFVSLAKAAGVPIVPVHVTGSNRWRYRFLRLFGRVLGRMMNFRELLASSGKHVHIRVGEPLLTAEIQAMSDAEVVREARRRLYSD
jgi:putative hemolysin